MDMGAFLTLMFIINGATIFAILMSIADSRQRIGKLEKQVDTVFEFSKNVYKDVHELNLTALQTLGVTKSEKLVKLDDCQNRKPEKSFSDEVQESVAKAATEWSKCKNND